MSYVNEAKQAFIELVNEEFYEKESKQYIRDEDIMAWQEDNKK